MRLLLARHGNTFETGDKVVWVGARTDLPLTAKGKEQAAQLASALGNLGIRPSRIIAGPLKRTREHAAIVANRLGVIPGTADFLSRTPSPCPSPQRGEGTLLQQPRSTPSPLGERVGVRGSPPRPLPSSMERQQHPLSPRGEGQGEGEFRSPSIEADASPLLVVDERLKEIDYGRWEGKSSEDILADFRKEVLDAWNRHGIWPADANWSPSLETITRNIGELTAELAATSARDDLVLLVTSNGILKFFLKLVPGAFEAMAGKEALKVGTGNVCMLRHPRSGWELDFWNLGPGQFEREWTR